jgi:hypothetical protein
MLQNLLVGVIVVGALVYAIWRLPGDATRLRYVAWMKRAGGGRGPLQRLALRLEKGLDGGSACGGCSGAGDHVEKRAQPGTVRTRRR